MTDQLQGERIVFRGWELDASLQLISTGVSESWWTRGSMVASCKYHDHPAPDLNCGCGLYGVYESHAAHGSVVGAIAVSGKVLIGPEGVRAERAKIVMLAYPSNDQRQRVLTQAAAERIGVPCCEVIDLDSLALEHGQPISLEERPERELAPGVPMPSGTVPENACRFRPLRHLKDAVYSGFTHEAILGMHDLKRVVLANNIIRGHWPSRYGIAIRDSQEIQIVANMIHGAKTPPVGAWKWLGGAALGGAVVGSALTPQILGLLL